LHVEEGSDVRILDFGFWISDWTAGAAGLRESRRRASAQSKIENPRSKIEFADVTAIPTAQPITALPKDLIDDGEIVILLLRPSPLYVVLSSLGGLVMIALITFALAYLARLPWVGWSDRQAFMLGFGLAGLRLGWQMLEWGSRMYVLTDRRIITRGGVLRVVVFHTQLKNIQHTSVFASVRERVAGLGTIGFATAGSDTFEAFWTMIRQPFAVHRIVVDAIRRYGK
jgi:hypothetical protein